jgi:hypothetical protein
MEYLFVSPLSQIFESLEKGSECKFSEIKFEYVQSVAFPVLETFIQSSKFSPRDSVKHKTPMVIVFDDSLRKNIGKVSLGSSEVYFDLVTSYNTLYGKGERQFWEISYKSYNGQMNTYINFESTLSGVTLQNMAVLPSTKGEWKKIYIDITDIIRQACNIATQVSVRLGISGSRINEDLDAYFHFEYVKLITMSAPY